MGILLLVAITILGSASYALGIKQMIQGKYVPSTFSRVVWVLLAINSFAAVILSHSSTASILLGGILLLGNIAMCVASLWKGTKELGRLEYICILLLILSALVWIFFKAPLLNLTISLIAHFIGAAPTFKKVWADPASESTGFWSLFFFASLLSIFASPGSSLQAIILPIYFTLFDGSLFLLSMRRKGRT